MKCRGSLDDFDRLEIAPDRYIPILTNEHNVQFFIECGMATSLNEHEDTDVPHDSVIKRNLPYSCTAHEACSCCAGVQDENCALAAHVQGSHVKPDYDCRWSACRPKKSCGRRCASCMRTRERCGDSELQKDLGGGHAEGNRK